MRALIWNTMLTAQMNACFWSRLARRYYTRERNAKIFLAIATSSTVAGWAFWLDNELLWKVLSGLSAIVALVLPFLNYPGMVEKMTKLATECARLRAEYDLLWARIDGMPANEILQAVSALNQRVVEISAGEAALPDDAELLLQCYEAVCRART
jgi:hypothetical protein